ncbi:MAG TPA: hypothetical protein VJ719_03095 [Chthoniobacterales bacterium]|nr:hypothetical protein [Chthoniobacterales bacterium]
MKSILGVFVILSVTATLAAQDETEQQIKQAQEAAKQMGVKMPDMQKLMEESAKEDETEVAATSATPTAAPSSSLAAPVSVNIPAGSAKGALTYDGNTSELKYAAAFTDQKDDRKPVVLIVSDQKLPIEKWTSEFDLMRDKTKWSGIVVFMDKEGEVYRTDVHNKGEQSSVSGIFDVKINDSKSNDITGVAKTTSDSAERKLDVTFHAVRK